MFTDYHAKYYAHELLSASTEDGVEKISRSLFDAALYALKSPLSKGVILGDEVGLGKIIEAAIVLCQYFGEWKRNLLIICPASIPPRQPLAATPQEGNLKHL